LRHVRSKKHAIRTQHTHTHNAQVMAQSTEQQQKLQAAELRVAEMQEESDMRARRSIHIPTHTQYILSRARSLAPSLSLACARALALSRSLALALSLSDVLVARVTTYPVRTLIHHGGRGSFLSYHIMFIVCLFGAQGEMNPCAHEHTHTCCAHAHAQTC
jgi:hypothetical protein